MFSLKDALFNYQFNSLKRVKTPVRRQIDSAECGPVALGIVLEYFGVYVSSNELRKACGVSRDGSRAINIIKAARFYGFEASGDSVEINTLKELKPPLILFWKFNHFVVLEGCKENYFYINDPVLGRRTVDQEEMDKSFTGVILNIKPPVDKNIKQFNKEKKPNIFKLFLENKLNLLTFFFFASFLVTSLSILGVYFGKYAVDNISLIKQMHWESAVLVIYTALVILLLLTIKIKKEFLFRLLLNRQLKKTPGFLNQILNLPLFSFQHRNVCELEGRVNDFKFHCDMLFRAVPEFIGAITALTIYSCVMFYIYYPIFFICLVTGSILTVLLVMIAKRRVRTSMFYKDSEEILFPFMFNTLKNITSIAIGAKASGSLEDFISRFNKTQSHRQEYILTNGIWRVIAQLFMLCSFSVIVWSAYHLMTVSHFSIGDMLVILGIYLLSLKEIQNVVKYIEAKTAYDWNIRLLNRIEKNNHSNHIGKTVSKENLHDNTLIKMDDVSYGYSMLDPPILNHFNFEIEKNCMIGLVGPTGACKGTILKLLVGLESPWNGQIIFKNTLVNDPNGSIFNPKVILIDRSPQLLRNTIEQNILYWNQKVNLEKIEKALLHSCLDDVIQSRNGILAWVDYQGKNISTSEAIRLQIASALINEPELLILDEVIDGFDSTIRKKLLHNIKTNGRSILISSYHHDSLQNCDKVYFLENGEIIDAGTHSELLSRNPAYRNLIVGRNNNG